MQRGRGPGACGGLGLLFRFFRANRLRGCGPVSKAPAWSPRQSSSALIACTPVDRGAMPCSRCHAGGAIAAAAAPQVINQPTDQILSMCGAAAAHLPAPPHPPRLPVALAAEPNPGPLVMLPLCGSRVFWRAWPPFAVRGLDCRPARRAWQFFFVCAAVMRCIVHVHASHALLPPLAIACSAWQFCCSSLPMGASIPSNP